MQTEAAPIGATSPGWQTVGSRRRRRQDTGNGPLAVTAAASEGEEHSDCSGDGGSCKTEEAISTGMERILSTSLPSPRQQVGFTAQLAADAASGVSRDAAAPLPLSPPRSNLYGLLQQQQQQQQQADEHSLGGLARQDSQSALSLADLARGGGLRSSKSEVATLSARSARSAARQRHSAQDSSPAGALDGGAESLPLEQVVESAATVDGPAQPRRGGCLCDA